MGSTTSPSYTTSRAKRLLFACEGCDQQTAVTFAKKLTAHGGDPAAMRRVCMDQSAVYAKGVGLALPQAQVSHDPFHLVSMAFEAMDQVRRTEMAEDAQAVRSALSAGDGRTRKQRPRGMRQNPQGWSRRPGAGGGRLGP